MRFIFSLFWVVLCALIFYRLDDKDDGVFYIIAAVITMIIVTILEVFLRSGEDRS